MKLSWAFEKGDLQKYLFEDTYIYIHIHIKSGCCILWGLWWCGFFMDISVHTQEVYLNLLRIYARESLWLMESKCIWNVYSLHLLGSKFIFFPLKFNTLSLHLNSKIVLNLQFPYLTTKKCCYFSMCTLWKQLPKYFLNSCPSLKKNKNFG